MQIHITNEVANWYKTELELQSGDYIRFFPRYGGVGGNIPGFSIGINNDEPIDSETLLEVDQISFYIEKKDKWYFEDKDLKVTLNKRLNEPEFEYI